MPRGFPDWQPTSEAVASSITVVQGLAGLTLVLPSPGVGFRYVLYEAWYSNQAAAVNFAQLVEYTSGGVVVRTLMAENLPASQSAPSRDLHALPLGENNKVQVANVTVNFVWVHLVYATIVV